MRQGIPVEVGLASGLDLFDATRWFEAHEVLEDAWRHLPKDTTDRHFLQGLIQLAVCLEHTRRGNPRGAAGQLAKARAHLAGVPDVWRGVDVRATERAFHGWWSAGARLDAAPRPVRQGL